MRNIYNLISHPFTVFGVAIVLKDINIVLSFFGLVLSILYTSIKIMNHFENKNKKNEKI